MLCPQCFTDWEVELDYIEHLEAHGLSPWSCRQLRSQFKCMQMRIWHDPSDVCACKMHGVKFRCEMMVYRAK